MCRAQGTGAGSHRRGRFLQQGGRQKRERAVGWRREPHNTQAPAQSHGSAPGLVTGPSLRMLTRAYFHDKIFFSWLFSLPTLQLFMFPAFSFAFFSFLPFLFPLTLPLMHPSLHSFADCSLPSHRKAWGHVTADSSPCPAAPAQLASPPQRAPSGQETKSDLSGRQRITPPAPVLPSAGSASQEGFSSGSQEGQLSSAPIAKPPPGSGAV